MDYTELKLEIRDRLLSELEVAYPVQEHLVVVRCPFCGDGKTRNKGHFYIKLNTRNPEEPILFMCQRCSESGVLTPSVMRSLELNDLQINSQLITFNNDNRRKNRRALGIHDNQLQLKVPHPDPGDIRNQRKLEYLNRRIGVELDFSDWVQMKTVFSFGQFIRENHIEQLTVNPNRARLLHENYVGVLTVRNEFINFRNLFKDNNLRYDKYSIVGELDNSRKFITIPNDIDILSTEPIVINLMEGYFDMYGVFFHVMNQQRKNHIYAAVTGSAFTSVLKYFFQMGIIGNNVIVNIFSDNNHNQYYYKKMIEEARPWVKEFHLFYNTILDKEGKSDYGVPGHLISLREEKIKF